jgi:hypothetical protein
MRIFYILVSIILLSTLEVKSQVHPSAGADQEAVLIKYYPNPAISVITFDFQKAVDKSYSFQIYNFLGKKVFEAPAIEQKTMINLSDFFRGIYIFQLKDQNGKILVTGKFQVSK